MAPLYLERKNNALKLQKLINQKLDNWNERSMFTIHGVKNLSKSDLDTLLIYCENFIEYGSYHNYYRPLRSIKEVLEKAGINITPDSFACDF